MGEKTGEGQSGEVNIGGSIGSVGGDISLAIITFLPELTLWLPKMMR